MLNGRAQCNDADSAIHGAEVNGCAAMAEFAMQGARLLGPAHHQGQFAGKIAVHAAGFEIGRHIRGYGEEHGTVGGFGGGASGIASALQFEIDVAVGGVSTNVAAAFIHLDVAIHGMKFADRFGADYAKRAVDVGAVVELCAARNVDGVIHGDFHTFFLGIARGNGQRFGLGVHVNVHHVEKSFLIGCAFDGANFDFVFVPCLDAHGAFTLFSSKEPSAFKG